MKRKQRINNKYDHMSYLGKNINVCNFVPSLIGNMISCFLSPMNGTFTGIVSHSTASCAIVTRMVINKILIFIQQCLCVGEDPQEGILFAWVFVTLRLIIFFYKKTSKKRQNTLGHRIARTLIVTARGYSNGKLRAGPTSSQQQQQGVTWVALKTVIQI